MIFNPNKEPRQLYGINYVPRNLFDLKLRYKKIRVSGTGTTDVTQCLFTNIR